MKMFKTNVIEVTEGKNVRKVMLDAIIADCFPELLKGMNLHM